MKISLDFTDTESMEGWIDQVTCDIDWIGKVDTAYVLEVLIKYKTYFEGYILDESQKLIYFWRKINDTILIFTNRLIDITLGKTAFILK